MRGASMSATNKSDDRTSCVSDADGARYTPPDTPTSADGVTITGVDERHPPSTFANTYHLTPEHANALRRFSLPTSLLTASHSNASLDLRRYEAAIARSAFCPTTTTSSQRRHTSAQHGHHTREDCGEQVSAKRAKPNDDVGSSQHQIGASIEDAELRQTFVDAIRAMMSGGDTVRRERRNVSEAIASAFSLTPAFAIADYSPPSVSSVANSTMSCGCGSSCLSFCSKCPMPRAHSVISEYEYDALLLQCHACWQSLSQTMIDSDFFSQILIDPISKSEASQRVACGLTAVDLEIGSTKHRYSYFELGVRRAISALRLINDFAALAQDSQMTLLKAALLSVLNIMAVSVFDAEANEWSLKITRDKVRRVSTTDAMQLFEPDSRGEVDEFLRRLGTFHAEFQRRFQNDHVPFVVMSLIHLFDPHRFVNNESDFAAELHQLKAKYVNFLRKYIHRHYGTPKPTGVKATTTTEPLDLSNTEANSTSDTCSARGLLHFCFEQLRTTVRDLDELAQRISTRVLVTSS